MVKREENAPPQERMADPGDEREALTRALAARPFAADNADHDVAERAKQKFLTHMSHELRTPINSVMGMTHLALRRATDPLQIDFLKKSLVANEHLLTVIGNIIDFAKLDAARPTPDETMFSLAQLIDDTLRQQDQSARAKGLELSRTIALALPDLLCGDALRLKQVLRHFVGNAIKFSKSGSITVRAQAVEDNGHSLLLRLEVSDQGIGLSREEQARLFQPFIQADDSSTRSYGGTGLGLAIAKRLVNVLGGDVGVISETGRGSTFWATVRLRPTPAVEAGAKNILAT
jgi:two-component system sensor histidine kinase/response regulator